MTLSTLISMVIGLVLPLVTYAITRDKLNATAKALILLFLSTVTGVWTSLAGAVPTNLTSWEHVLLNLLMTYLMAAVSYIASQHTTVAARIKTATKGFGIGPS